MNHEDDLLGLRDDDLSTAERHARDARIADPARRREHEAALALGRRVATLPEVPTTPTPTRSPRHAWVGALAVAATIALVLVARQDIPSVRARGSRLGSTSIVLRAAAEGQTGTRRLVDGDPVRSTERVVFEVETTVAGELTIEEEGAAPRRVWPAGATSWQVAPGRHLVGGAQPQAWRPDEPGARRYVATLCPADGAACTTTTLDLRWEAQ